MLRAIRAVARAVSLSAAATTLAVAGAACGDGDDDGIPADTGTAGTTAAVQIDVEAVVPDLTGSGFNQTIPERIPNTGELQIAFSVYERAGPPAVQARAEARLYPTDAIADQDFELQAAGWRSPPPGLFGGDPANVDAEPLEGFDEAAAYIATNRDPQGFRLWTDVIRSGRVIVVAHVLGQNEADVLPVRQAIADSLR